MKKDREGNSLPSNRVITAGIVADGFCRARDAAEPNIRYVVLQEFAPQLLTAPFWKRWWIQRRIEREVQRRLSKAAPRNALY